MKDLVAFPAMAIAAYAEHLLEGRRVVLFGDSTSDLPEVLIQRGARLVHVYDADLTRVAEASARGTTNDISYAPLGQSGVAARDGAFDFGIVLNVAAFDDGRKLITRLRRALAPRGIAIVAAPNPEAHSPLIADHEGMVGPSYYDLYEWVTAEFDEVRMLGQLPVCGYALADFGAEGEPDFALDTSFLANGAEEPDWYLALASHFPVSVDAFTIVQVPRGSLRREKPEDENQRLDELSRNNAQLEAEVARLRKLERTAQKSNKEDEKTADLERRAREREALVRDLETRLSEAQARIEQAEEEATEAHTALRSSEERESAARAEAEKANPLDIEVARSEVQALESKLEERGRECQRLSQELLVADKLARELVSEVETLKQSMDGSLPNPALAELHERLRRTEESEARRVADLTTAKWTIEQLRNQLQEPVPTSTPGGSA